MVKKKETMVKETESIVGTLENIIRTGPQAKQSAKAQLMLMFQTATNIGMHGVVERIIGMAMITTRITTITTWATS